MKITIVTVCLNAEKTIKKTIESVLNQSYSNIEYLIIDGKSNDKTIEIIKGYMMDSRIIFVSEKDKGLYNAMNVAIQMSSGDYIIFMNSGDVFCDNKVIADFIQYMYADIVYGNAIRNFQDGSKRETYKGKYKLLCMLLMGRMMCHQAVFTKTVIMKQYGFDEQYRICADYDFILRAKKDKCNMCYINRDVCIVDNVEGISSQKSNYYTMRTEDDRSLKKNMPLLYNLIILPKKVYRIIHDNSR